MPGKLAGHGLRFTDHVRHAYWSAFRNGCVTTAKAAAYSAVFAIFPALLVAAACVTLLPDFAPLRVELAVFFNRVLPESVAPLLEDFFINADKSPQSTSVLVGAATVSFTGAAGVIGTLMEGFRRAYDLPMDAWGQIQRRVRSHVLLLISFIPITIASVLVIFGHYITLWVMEWQRPELTTAFYVVANLLRWMIALGAMISMLAVIYRFGVPKKLRWREVFPGAAFATVTWFFTALGFGWYVTHFANYSRVYGSLGTGIVLMVWLFLTALSVLCGAELNAELFQKKKPERARR
ncbi:MAG: YihY/virulence factor BrkB family protein [Acidobacteria bacterium]|nr:YihY/virulence factor BrkB family protein [Acidobacteriota bacterium]